MKARPVEVCFVTRIADAPPGEIHVSRVDKSTSGMVTHTYGPAQILVAAGKPAPSPPAQTPAEMEIEVEELYRNHSRVRFTHGDLPDVLDPHRYLLQDPEDCEEQYLEQTPLPDVTDLVLARAMELQGHGSAKEIWKDKANTHQSLFVRVFGPGAAGKGGGRGKAKAKAKAKGKAKGKGKAKAKAKAKGGK